MTSEASSIRVHAPVPVPACSHTTEPPSPDDYGRMAEVIVIQGSARRTFSIYSNLLSHYPGHFRKQIQMCRVRRSALQFSLYGDTLESFRAFFNWITTKKLYARLTEDGEIPLTQMKILDAYVLAQDREIPEFADASLDLFFQKVGQDWTLEPMVVKAAYEKTRVEAPIRRLMVQMVTEKLGLANLGDFEDVCPKEFLVDILQDIKQQGGTIPLHRHWSIGKFLHTKKHDLCSQSHEHRPTGHEYH